MDDKQRWLLIQLMNKAFEKWSKQNPALVSPILYAATQENNIGKILVDNLKSERKKGYTAGSEDGSKQGRIETLVGVMEFISNTDLETSHLLNYRKIEEYIDTELKKERQSDE